MKLQSERSLHPGKHIISSVGIDLHLLDILVLALFVSDPPDPGPVSYILTL